ncbi:MAG: dihydrofolate reductase [Tatlockia sp.]|jgi:dihydrofolate reductase
MTLIRLVAAIDEQYGLGKDNALLCHLPADLQHFKNITLGKPIIMGRKTYESIGRALPGRLNIVLSTQQMEIEGVEVVDSLEKAFALLSEVKEAAVIGGAALFKQAMPYASRMDLTVIHHTFAADVFFPSFNAADWHCTEKCFRLKDEKNSYDLTFYHYERLTPPTKSSF